MSITKPGPESSGPGVVFRRALLLAGPVATLLYVGLDTVAARRHPGYRYASQTISELSAVDAPTRPLWLTVGSLYGLLMMAFGLGVWLSAGAKGALRIVGVMAGVIGVVGLIAWPFAPMHQREVLAAGGGTRSDKVHIALGAVDSALFLTAAGLGATAIGGKFRLYSMTAIALVLGIGASMAAEGPKVGRNEPTPFLGIKERIVVFGTMVWMAVLGIVLLRHEGGSLDEKDPREVEV